MLNLSDKELDRLSREAAGRYEIETEISTWDKLAQQLDREMGTPPQPPSGSRFGGTPVVYASLIILLAGMSWFLFKAGKNNTSPKNAHAIVLSTSGKTENPASAKNTEDHIGKTSANNSSQAASPDKNNAAHKQVLVDQPTANAAKDRQQADQAEAEKSIVRDEKNESTNSVSAASKDKSVPATGNLTYQQRSDAVSLRAKEQKIPANNKETRSNQTGNAAVIGNQESNRHNLASNHHRNPNEAMEQGSQPGRYVANAGQVADIHHATPAGDNTDKAMSLAILPQRVLVANSPLVDDSFLQSLRSRVGNDLLADALKKNASPLRISRPFKIGLMFAPDVTNAGAPNNSKLSSNFGLAVTYPIFKRWSVNTGLIFTKKNYASAGYEFKATNDWWLVDLRNRGGTLEHVQGSCNMLEIPLNLQYDLGTAGKTRVFISGGLSSYLMRHEFYDYYYYYYPNSTLKNKQFGYDTHANYWFGIVNLSMGVEYTFSRSFSLQVEPLLKLPLSGVGIGNLQLTSYGLSFSLQYAPVLKTTRK